MPNGKGELDPYAIFRALEGHGVRYVVIGALGQVIRGAQTTTSAIDIVPHPRANELQRLEPALAELEAQRCDGDPLVVDLEALSREPVVRLATSAGGVGIVLEPAGTRGYHDLRRRATREAIGDGLSPSFASIGDLARMVAALGRPDESERLRELRHIMDIEGEQRRRARARRRQTPSRIGGNEAPGLD